ncbi:MAG TPA: DUF2946 domain-containing protein [Paraburkholderia sp.]|jgi:hypothetical protein|nr:DUF2946 domain-containing protein [Paraburkholderia sp.]
MLRRHLRKIGSILGLLAILMATLAPTVSQALSGHDRLDVALADLCSAQNGESAHGVAAPDAAAGAPNSSHTPTLHLEACGYCGLLAHCPVVPPVPLAFATQAAFAYAAVVHASVTRPSIAPVRSAQPRAPPVAVL